MSTSGEFHLLGQPLTNKQSNETIHNYCIQMVRDDPNEAPILAGLLAGLSNLSSLLVIWHLKKDSIDVQSAFRFKLKSDQSFYTLKQIKNNVVAVSMDKTLEIFDIDKR